MDAQEIRLSWRLGDEADAVPQVRRSVGQALRRLGVDEALVSDAQVVVTELASNALLHAGPPVQVRLAGTEASVRLEVQDASPAPPVRPLAGTDSMTGRGLSLVSALAARWAAHPVSGGKTVWAELRPHADPSSSPREEQTVEAVLAAWPDVRAGGEPTVTVKVGDVPTSLLLAAKAHVDNVVREFSLAVAGERAGETARITPDLARLIRTVTTRFADARRSIKQQALKAADAGAERTMLTLTLPMSAVAAGREYLEALDEVDAYARAARLLTLESPPEHRAFRRWYVTSLIDQLEAVRSGKPLVPPTFEHFLLAELGTVATAKRVADRAARLQGVTAALAGAQSLDQVADVVLSEGVAALGASGGGLLMASDGDQVSVPGTVGYSAELVRRMSMESRDDRLPGAVALATGQAIWLESLRERESRFPELGRLEPGAISMCAVPLRAGEHVLGALRFSFERPRLFDQDERTFVEALAAQTSVAVERTQLREAERQARHEAETVAQQLAHLQRVTSSLAAASTYAEIGAAIVAQAPAVLGAVLSAVSVLDGDTLRIVGLGGEADDVSDWPAYPLDADLPASEAVRTNTAVVVPGRAALVERFPALRDQVHTEGSRVSVPVTAGGRPLGALSLRFSEGHEVDQAQLDLVATLARQCGVALERARLFAEERAAGERASLVAEAARLLSASLDPAQTVTALTDVLVPRFGDRASVHVAGEDGQLDRVAESAGPGDPTAPLWPPDPALLRDVLRRANDAPLGRVVTTDGPGAGAVVPLVVRGQARAVLYIARSAGGAYTPKERALLDDVAARAAVAFENAETYQRERDAALTLQQSLLPQRLPQVAGVSLAWRYLPGTAGSQIGGDWYDVIPLDDGRVALVIGDVMGRGLQAAALMGQLRASARAHASTEMRPADVLRRLDIAVAGLEQEQITTALCGLLDPRDGSLHLAVAGHLPPLLTSANGPRYVDVLPGPPLGVGFADYEETSVCMQPGDGLLLFTDGLVESRERPVDVGLGLLCAALVDVDDPEEMCERALRALGLDGAHDDDTALLAVSLTR